MYFINSNGSSTLALKSFRENSQHRPDPPGGGGGGGGGDKKLRARPGDALRKLEDPAAQERKLDEWRRLVLLGAACQKKLMAEDPEYRDRSPWPGSTCKEC